MKRPLAKDLVDRMREARDLPSSQRDDDLFVLYQALLDEGADEIEHLRSKCERLRDLFKELRDDIMEAFDRLPWDL